MLLLLWLSSLLIAIAYTAKVEYDCGVEFTGSPNSQIIFGTHLKQYEHPWFCDFTVEFNGHSSHCSAVLISSEYIMTAAHCFDDSKLPQHEKFITLRCGSADNMIGVKALKVIKHQAFTDTQMHDLALIKIQKVPFGPYLRPICLTSYETIMENSSLTVLGSGLEFLTLAERAKKAELKVKSLQKCTSIYGKWAHSGRNILCAGTIFTGVRQGDSGGPLIALYEDRHYLIGITSAKRIDNYLASILRQDENPILFSRVAPECKTFIATNSDVQCHNNVVPISARTDSHTPCGEMSEGRMKHLLNNENITYPQPWYCKILDGNDNDICAGTLVSFREVLTAATCLDNVKSEELTLKCGIYLQTTSKASKIRIHPDYNSRTRANDIAVIELTKKIKFDGNVGVACLTTNDEIDNHNNQLAIIPKLSKTNNPVGNPLPSADIADCKNSPLTVDASVLHLCKRDKSSAVENGSSLLSKIGNKWHIVGVATKQSTDPNRSQFIRVSDYCNFITLKGNLICSFTSLTGFSSTFIYVLSLVVIVNIMKQ